MSRNATLMSRLPPEVLSLIFCYVRHDAADRESIFDNPQDDGTSQVKRWIIIAHVCHMWREVAIGNSSLWSHLFLTRRNHEWTKECFRRSKQAPRLLSLDFSTDGKRPHRPARALLLELRNHLGRCRVLSLYLNSGDLNDFLSNAEAPCLVDFQCCRLIYKSSVRRKRKPVVIGDSTLHADSLRRLSITFCIIDWDASIFHRLVHLRLESVSNKLKCRDFVRFLAGIPSLEVLDLCDFIQPRSSNSGRPPAKKLHIQHLKHLELDGRRLDMAELLSSIIVPPSCKVFINVLGSIHDTPGGEFLPSVPGVNNDNLHHDSDQYFWQSLRLFHLEEHFGVQGYAVKGNLTQNEILFEYCVWRGVDNLSCFIPECLLSPLPISRIVYLELCGHWSILSRRVWLTMFSPIKTLETICIDAPCGPFFRALLHDPGPSADIPFPALSSITVRGNESCCLEYDQLLRSLRWRLGLGAPLRTLVIQGPCAIPPSSVTKILKEVVEKVEIEGPGTL